MSRPTKNASAPPFRATLRIQRDGGRQSERSGWLTPYEIRTLVADARWAGPGSRLDVWVPAGVGDLELRRLRTRFARLRDFRVTAQVERDSAWQYRDYPAQRA